MKESDSRRFHYTNSSRETKPMLMKLEGSQTVWFAFSALVALLSFNFMFDALIFSFWLSIFVSGMIPILTLLFIYVFMRDKPSAYARQWFEAVRLDFTGKGLLNTKSEKDV